LPGYELYVPLDMIDADLLSLSGRNAIDALRRDAAVVREIGYGSRQFQASCFWEITPDFPGINKE
jgi:hypothetical protein